MFKIYTLHNCDYGKIIIFAPTEEKAQRQRLEEAGLTPALMMNGGNDGIAQSTGVASVHVNSSQVPQMQAPNQVEFTSFCFWS